MSAKNKFMTKALAVVLSASMALSLSSATALTANAAAAPKLAKKTVSVKAGKKAKNKLKAASYKAGWRITKATVKKTAVAKAKVKKNKKVVVVTGVKKGATKIVLKLKNAKTGAAKKLKFKANVKAVETPIVSDNNAVETASIIAAKQTTDDSVILTFDKAVDANMVSKDTVAINGSVGAATSVTLGSDGLSATVVYGYAENTEYTFAVTNLGGTATIKTGSYAVTDIKIEDQVVEAGSDQDIVYALMAGDINVTKYNNYLDYVVFDFDGDFTSFTTTDMAVPKIYFSDKDQKATVKVTYNNTVDPEISKTVTITSTAATATKAEARFADKLLKWYLVDDSTTSYNIRTDATDPQKVVFYAKDKDGKAVKYSDVEVLSSNENVATVDWEVSPTGKCVLIKASAGGNAGSAKITVKTTENKGNDDVNNEFSFDIVAKEKNNNLFDVKAGASTVNLNNSPYGCETDVVMNPVNSLGETVDGDADSLFAIEVVNSKNEDASDEVSAVPWNDNGTWKLKINALGATEKSYKVNVVVTGESGNEKKKFVTVKVADALSGVMTEWDVTADGKIMGTLKKAADISATYAVETKDLFITDYQDNLVEKEVALVAKVASKPVGYLTTEGVKGFDASIAADLEKRLLSKKAKDDNADLYNLNVYVSVGNKYYTRKGDGTLYLGQTNDKNDREYITEKKAYESKNAIKVGQVVSLYTSDNNIKQPIYYYGDKSPKNTCATAGKYNVKVSYGAFEGGIQLGVGSFNVSYSLTTPTYKVNDSEQAEVFVNADVDMVRDEDGASVSWTTKKYADGYVFGTDSLSKGDKVTAICVKDYRGGKWWSKGESSDYFGAQGYGEGWGEPMVLINFIIEKNITIKA